MMLKRYPTHFFLTSQDQTGQPPFSYKSYLKHISVKEGNLPLTNIGEMDGCQIEWARLESFLHNHYHNSAALSVW